MTPMVVYKAGPVTVTFDVDNDEVWLESAVTGLDHAVTVDEARHVADGIIAVLDREHT